MSNISNLRIGHLNVRSLERHIDGVKLVLDANRYHLFAVTETKLKKSSPVGPVLVPGYNFIRHSLPIERGRGSKACGGVGIYVRKGLRASLIIKSSHDIAVPIASRVEFMVVQVQIEELNIGVAVLYNPSCSNQTFSQHYENVLLEMLDYGFDRTFILGDFNINVTANPPSANLNLPTGPTRITDTCASTIHLLITDCPQHIKKAKATSASSISDHEVVFLIADIRVRRPPQRTIRARCFRSIDPVRLQTNFQARDFQHFFTVDDV